MKRLLILFIVFTASVCSLYSQNKTIKGRVLSEHLDILTGTSIMINDTVEVGRVDMNGFFQIDIPISKKRITFRFLGVEPTTIELVDDCNIEVVLMLSSTYDFISPRRVDRKRKKRYKKLPEIHKQAFEKGIFETENACYKREFESLYLSDRER
ncbi:hypothetical protein AAG747_19190 [Rapidithrix thailandica]|uniref:Carboxypeptidase-like regulatory domain-containing protein n=1 Tax=Rapidithrix thailandica TaxID=413964 RepID=A0AAW9SH77_9BACT